MRYCYDILDSLLLVWYRAAEFLPISSSGHLAIAQNLLHIEAPQRAGILRRAAPSGYADRGVRRLLEGYLRWWWSFPGIGDLPTAHAVAGTAGPAADPAGSWVLPLFAVLPIRKAAGSGRQYGIRRRALIVTGFLPFLCDQVRKGHKTERSATWLTPCWWAGQAVATLPGVLLARHDHHRRCFVGYERRFAVRFSFPLSISPCWAPTSCPSATR
ncbi:MAG: hypothetical protein ACLVH7_16850 [Flavonifractor plautii]